MSSTQARPALTVDVNAAQHPQRRGGPSKAIAHNMMASAQADASGSVRGELRSGSAIRPGDIISEDDLNAQGGFSSDEEGGTDVYGMGQHAQPVAGKGVLAGASTHQHEQQQQNYSVDSQDFVDSDSSGEEHYGQEGDVDMGSEDEDGPYDEDDDELSSSPSIPDENIDFDLVYALHNFVATVEGQATVNKGNSLTLLDDSNSYWWLVRVLRTQEVGYIPAENIETPYERLARLNKHRNVDLTSATDDDHNQVPENIITSHLIKQRSFGLKGYSHHSGKLSALSRRNHGPEPLRSSVQEQGKRGVQFGPPTYLEHSGNEYSDEEEDEEEYDDEEMMEIEEDEEGASGDEGDEGEGEDEEERRHAEAAHRQIAAGPQHHGVQAQHMEPDDGMGWDARETEKVQRAQEDRSAARQAAEQRVSSDSQSSQQRQVQQQRLQEQQQQQLLQSQKQEQQLQEQARRQQQSQQEQQARQKTALQQPQQQDSQQSQRQRHADGSRVEATHTVAAQQQQRGTEAAQARGSQQGQKPIDRLSTSTASSSGSLAGGFLPSQVLASSRDRASSDASAQGPQASERASPSSADSKKDKRVSNRKSRGEEDNADAKQGKKRSGVFSGLFSRSKDRKERKSGHFSNSSYDSESNARMSEDSNPRQSITLSGGGVQPTGAGRALQERDRIQQEAYQKHFLQDGRSDARSTRPGSLIATPGSAPMLNVLRVFAGNDLDSGATFKTVLLNQSTTAAELVRQAMQRFRLDVDGEAGEYCLTAKLVEGDERVLETWERPLQVFDQLTEALVAANHEMTASTMPSVKRSSVGSISSIASNLSMHPAIARLESDFSDDHHVKFYLHRTAPADASHTSQSSMMLGVDGKPGTGLSLRGVNMQLTDSNDSYAQMRGNSLQPGDDSMSGIAQNLRFALRLLIFPSDLPEGIVFDPQTNALIPRKALDARGPTSHHPSEGVSQDYREKIMALPRNTTVAEVIEQGLERFGILDGVVEGGDDVEDRSSRRRSKSRIRYGLCVKTEEKERSLHPSGKVVDAFPVPPQFRAGPTSRRGKRGSTDSAMLLSIADNLRLDDPVFILRQVQRQHSRTSRPLSPTENVLATKQDERRQAELGTVAPTPSDRALEEARGGATPADQEQQGMSRQELIAAQRAAARERRAAVLGSQPNEENGVDVMLEDRSRLRSSKMLDTGRMRYSFIPVSGEEHDISAIVEEVLRSENATMEGLLSAPRPPLHATRSASATTIEDYVSAPGSPISKSPLSLAEVHASVPSMPIGSTRAIPNDDVLHRLVRDGNNGSETVEDRIDQVLARLGNVPSSAAAGQQLPPRSARRSHGAPGGSTSSSHETASPISGHTHPSGTTTPTPLSMLTSTGGTAVAAAATRTAYRVGVGVPGDPSSPGVTLGNDGRITSSSPAMASVASSITPRGLTKSPLLPPASVTDVGIAHLYAIAEAAARRKPPRRMQSKSVLSVGGSGGDAGDDNLTTSVAGLFPPQAPYIDDRRVKDAYAPIGRHLNGLEDTLDRLLADALRL